jgi:hypothetical protein
VKQQWVDSDVGHSHYPDSDYQLMEIRLILIKKKDELKIVSSEIIIYNRPKIISSKTSRAILANIDQYKPSLVYITSLGVKYTNRANEAIFSTKWT